jgi:hypothetical protein
MPWVEEDNYRLGSTLSGAAKGAAIGSVVPVIGTALGAAIGGLTGLFGSGESPEKQRQRRKRELLAQLAENRRKAIEDGTRLLTTRQRGVIEGERQAGARRALAMGHATDAEDIIQPTVQRIAAEGSRNLESFVTQTNANFDQQIAQIEADFAERPMQPSLSDTLMSLGADLTDSLMDQQFMDIQRARYGLPEKKSEYGAWGALGNLFGGGSAAPVAATNSTPLSRYTPPSSASKAEVVARAGGRFALEGVQSLFSY